MQRFFDRDFLETTEGYIFCVIGCIHPEDRVISYLKYIPCSEGKWFRRNLRYQRILQFYTIPNLIKTLNFLNKKPSYLFNSKVYGIKISAVPLAKILKHYKPRDKLVMLLQKKCNDSLQRKTIELIKALSEKSGVNKKYFGITGSILLDIHQKFSDIDLTVYGLNNYKKIKNTLLQEYKIDSKINRYDDDEIEKWCNNNSKKYPLAFKEAYSIFSRYWNRGFFIDKKFSIHPVKLENEISENYGDKIFISKGLVRIEAVIVDDCEANFLPSKYKIADVDVLRGEKIENIEEVVSYDSLYSGIVEIGEKILAYGKLEEVHDVKNCRKYYRVLVGSQEALGKDYIKPILKQP